MRPAGTGKRPVTTLLAWTLVILALALVSGIAVTIVGDTLFDLGPLRLVLAATVVVLILLLGVRTVRNHRAAHQGTK